MNCPIFGPIEAMIYPDLVFGIRKLKRKNKNPLENNPPSNQRPKRMIKRINVAKKKI